MSKRHNLTNNRFGRCVALTVAHGGSSGMPVMWNCRCDCGTIFIGRSYALVRGKTKCCKPCLSKGRSLRGARLKPTYSISSILEEDLCLNELSFY